MPALHSASHFLQKLLPIGRLAEPLELCIGWLNSPSAMHLVRPVRNLPSPVWRRTRRGGGDEASVTLDPVTDVQQFASQLFGQHQFGRPGCRNKIGVAMDQLPKTTDLFIGASDTAENSAKSGACGKPIEIWFADEARVGQKNKITRR